VSGLRGALPGLVPLAVEWAQRVSAGAAATGQELGVAGEAIARQVGVVRTSDVRVVVADALPFPDHALLRAAALELGLLGPTMAGLTLGHAIFIREGHVSARLLSHELRHVAQYEAAGSIEAFLPVYLEQILDFGYEAAPYEVDARRHETGHPPTRV
jgi:hypothetical protein